MNDLGQSLTNSILRSLRALLVSYRDKFSEHRPSFAIICDRLEDMMLAPQHDNTAVSVDENLTAAEDTWSLFRVVGLCCSSGSASNPSPPSPPPLSSAASRGGSLRELSVVEEEEERADNEVVFRTLRMRPILGEFFKTFNDDFGIHGSAGVLEVGEKFAEGTHAELFNARVMWKDPEKEKDLGRGVEYALKVFRRGISLRHLQSQWPLGMLLLCAEEAERKMLGEPQPFRCCCDIRCGTLLADGRFAFLMRREQENLRSCIDRNMLTSRQGPFGSEESEIIMSQIAVGMYWLHSHEIVHRNLKSTKVLLTKTQNYSRVLVAGFECSIGVAGTVLKWLAPEILQAIKDRSLFQRPELFTRASDVYSYGMTCYEVLTGKRPFDNHPSNDYDLILSGHRPEVPEYVQDWARELLNRCWQSDPYCRPSFEEILYLLEANSAAVRDQAEWIELKMARDEGEWSGGGV